MLRSEMGRRKKEKRKTSLKQRPAVTTDATVILCRFSTWPSDYERIRTLGGSRVHRTSRPTTTTYRLRARIEPTSFHLRRKKKKKMQLLFPTNNLTCGRRILRRAAQIGAGHISRDIISRRPVHLLSSDDGRIRPAGDKKKSPAMADDEHRVVSFIDCARSILLWCQPKKHKHRSLHPTAVHAAADKNNTKVYHRLDATLSRRRNSTLASFIPKRRCKLCHC